MTKARPLSFRIAGSMLSRAVSPPAEAPMPTTGTVELPMGFPSLPSSSAFDLGITTHRFLLFGRAASRAGKAAAHQLAHQQRVLLVFARPTVQVVGEVMPILGALAGRQLSRQRRPLLVRALQRSQHSLDLLSLGGEDGIGTEGMAHMAPIPQHGHLFDGPHGSVAFRASEARKLARPVLGFHSCKLLGGDR